MDRTERLLDLVALLLGASEPIPFAELRESFPDDYGGARDAAERKLERDKAELLQLGVPIEFVPPQYDDERDIGGYRIDRGAYFLPDPGFTPEEAAALYAAASAALASRDFPFAQDLAHALRKLSVGSPDTASGREAAARGLLVVRPGDPGRAAKLSTLADAVARRKRVKLRYRAQSTGEVTEREVDPYGLAFRHGAWKLVGYCHLRTDQRVFALDRVEWLDVNEQKPAQPDFAIPDGFDAGEVAGLRPWLWRTSEPMQVTLRFAPGSELLAERAFDATKRTEATLTVTNLDGLLSQVLGQAERVFIAAPQSARARARAALLAIRDVHSAPPVARALEPSPPPARVSGEAPRQADKRERLRRLLLIVPAARRRPGITVAQLARELGLPVEELLADIDLLAMVGRPPFSPDDLIDISVDERGRVAVALDQSFSRTPQLTALEALALAAAAQETAPADPVVMFGVQKLTARLPPRARELYSALAHRVVAAAPAPRGTEEILATLRRAAEARREIALEYDSGETKERIIHPRAVLQHRGGWYVHAHDVGRGAARTFRADRIRSARETGATFPDMGPLDAALFERDTLFFPTGAERSVTLRFSPRVEAWALARHGENARRISGGGAEATIESAGVSYVVALVLSFAGEAEVVAPPDVRAAVRDAAGRALTRYEQGEAR
ncbi:MAG: helix-turn-helix transcriptional regulator [Myxococcales bacterium]